MVGPDADRDIFVLGSMWIDLLAPAAGRPVVPYVVSAAATWAIATSWAAVRYPWTTRARSPPAAARGCGSAIASTSAATSGSAGSCTCAPRPTSGVTWPRALRRGGRARAAGIR